MSITVLPVVLPAKINPRLPVGLDDGVELLSARSGRVYPIDRWSRQKHTYSAEYGPVQHADIDELKSFYFAIGGRSQGFLIEDKSDYSSNGPQGVPDDEDQNLGTGDGVETDFQLRKAYTHGAQTYYRKITRPQSGSVVVAVDGVAQTEGVDFTVSTTTGIITFTSPPSGSPAPVITAGFKFYVPVHFTANVMEILHNLNFTGTADIPMQEVFE